MEGVAAYVADDITYQGPLAIAEGLEAYLTAVGGFSELVSEVRKRSSCSAESCSAWPPANIRGGGPHLDNAVAAGPTRWPGAIQRCIAPISEGHVLARRARRSERSSTIRREPCRRSLARTRLEGLRGTRRPADSQRRGWRERGDVASGWLASADLLGCG